jgi:hypothetical protein
VRQQIFNGNAPDAPVSSGETSTVKQNANAISSYTETEVRTTTVTEQVRSPGLARAGQYLGWAGDLLDAGSNLVGNLADPAKRQDAARVAAEFLVDAGAGLGIGTVSGLAGTAVGTGITVGGTLATGGVGSPAAAYTGIVAGAATAAYVDYKLGETFKPYRNDAVASLTNVINSSATAISGAVDTSRMLINRHWQWGQIAWDSWR